MAASSSLVFTRESKPAPWIRSVVSVGSASGHTGSEFPEYAASKGGILSYTKNVANRLAPQGICNSVDPGGVLTELNRPVMDDAAMWERIMQLTPLRRWAEP
ncbi:MAG: SDR family oxidoreductase, partial [Slackia isoflavoniconvertens]|nr:SDR family oxidoreductase [Slackia isoflavoniconvertens]